MKNLIKKLVQYRNPSFTFDEGLTDSMFFTFVMQQIFAVLRGARILFFFRNPKMMMRGKRVSLINSAKIRWGSFLKLGNDVYINALGKEKITLGNNVSIGSFSRIIISTSFNNLGSHITIGNNVGMGEFAYLGGAGGLEIGDDCIIGQYFSCHPENHIYNNANDLIRNQAVSRKGIVIGKNCWIGSKVTILDGVQIGDGCVIAAGAVVTKSFPANSVIAGVPAKIIADRSLPKITNSIKAIA